MLIKFKNNNFILPVIYIYDLQPENIYQELINKIKKSPKFFINTPIVINVENIINPNNWPKLYQAILNTKLYIIGVCSCNNEILKQIILNSGLPILNEEKIYKQNITQKKIKQTILKNTKIIYKPIRSGQQIYARESDLIIINSVNAGAEIIADGNIHIYGIMKGRVLAGASGNKNSQIFCTNFSPELISISGEYWSNEQIPINFFGKSVRICLQNNILNIYNL